MPNTWHRYCTWVQICWHPSPGLKLYHIKCVWSTVRYRHNEFARIQIKRTQLKGSYNSTPGTLLTIWKGISFINKNLVMFITCLGKIKKVQLKSKLPNFTFFWGPLILIPWLPTNRLISQLNHDWKTVLRTSLLAQLKVCTAASQLWSQWERQNTMLGLLDLSMRIMHLQIVLVFLGGCARLHR